MVVVVVAHARLPAHLLLAACSVCRALRVHQSASGASPSIRLRPMLSLVASRSWAWCFIHFVLVLVSDPTVGFSPLASSCPPTAQPLVVLGVTVMDPHTFSLSLSRPSHPIPSCPSPWWSWWFAAFLARSAFCCLLPRAGPLSPSPSNPSHPPLARPSEQLDVPIPTLTLIPVQILLSPPHPHGVSGSHSPVSSLFASCLLSLFSSHSLVLFALVVWVWSGPVRSGSALPFLPCRALSRLALPCPGPALPCVGLVWL